jgi:molybdopterin molybdotransferase
MEAYPVLSVEEAQERILSYFHALEPERADIFQALGRVLAEDVYADMNIPPLDNTAMDGYAVRAADTAGASAESPVTLQVIHDLAAGYVTDVCVTSGTAIRIMTGAPIPGGADAVVPFEETDEAGNRPAGGEGGRSAAPRPEAPKGLTQVRVLKAAQLAANIRRAGEDVRQGARVLATGSVVRPAEVGLLASVGRSAVQVIRRPRVAILATGDELVEVDQVPGPGQIRNSNNYTVAASVLRHGGIPLMLGIARDNVQDLTARIKAGLDQHPDLFITSGGVSVGDFDVVKNVLAAEGEIGFWRVRMKPGKPLAFGLLRGVPHLGLPGNPVSSLVSFELFARPALLVMQGKPPDPLRQVDAVFVDGLRRKDDRRHYLRVIVEERDGQATARLTGEQGSGILSSMTRANGLAVIPEEASAVAPGSRVQVLMLE